MARKWSLLERAVIATIAVPGIAVLALMNVLVAREGLARLTGSSVPGFTGSFPLALLILVMFDGVALLVGRVLLGLRRGRPLGFEPRTRGSLRLLPVVQGPFDGAIGVLFIGGMLAMPVILFVWDERPPGWPVILVLGGALAEYVRRAIRRSRGADCLVIDAAARTMTLPRTRRSTGRRTISIDEIAGVEVTFSEGPLGENDKPTKNGQATIAMRDGERIGVGDAGFVLFAAHVVRVLGAALDRLGVLGLSAISRPASR